MKFLKQEIDNFLDYIEKTKNPLTKKTYANVLKQAINHIEVEDNKINIMGYRIKIADQKKSTIAKKISAIRSFVEYLNQKGYKFKLIGDEQVKVPKTLPKPIHEKYIKEALSKTTLDEYILINVIFSLGLRISEASNLTLKDISKEWVRITGKGNKTRYIPIHPILYNDIKQYIEIFAPQKYLFEKNSKQMTESQLRYKIDKIFKKIGIKATPHQLRHSFATLMLNNGARINDVSELLGHEYLSTTQIYTKLNNTTKLKNYLNSHPLCGGDK